MNNASEVVRKSVLDLAIERDGISVVENCFSRNWLDKLSATLPETHANIRNGLNLRSIGDLALSQIIRDVVDPILGKNCFAVRAVLFNKNSTSNWKVSWHQDCFIAVKAHVDIRGWGPWSVKLGV